MPVRINWLHGLEIIAPAQDDYFVLLVRPSGIENADTLRRSLTVAVLKLDVTWWVRHRKCPLEIRGLPNMKRRGPPDSSLELLLDTICNTFGGVLFSSILVCIILRNTGQFEYSSTGSRTTGSPRQK